MIMNYEMHSVLFQLRKTVLLFSWQQGVQVKRFLFWLLIQKAFLKWLRQNPLALFKNQESAVQE